MNVELFYMIAAGGIALAVAYVLSAYAVGCWLRIVDDVRGDRVATTIVINGTIDEDGVLQEKR